MDVFQDVGSIPTTSTIFMPRATPAKQAWPHGIKSVKFVSFSLSFFLEQRSFPPFFFNRFSGSLQKSSIILGEYS
jgi:hypothetical protein